MIENFVSSAVDWSKWRTIEDSVDGPISNYGKELNDNVPVTTKKNRVPHAKHCSVSHEPTKKDFFTFVQSGLYKTTAGRLSFSTKLESIFIMLSQYSWWIKVHLMLCPFWNAVITYKKSVSEQNSKKTQ